jgi:hypothetical protein
VPTFYHALIIYSLSRCVCRQVYMAREKATGEVVALKKVRMDNEKEGVWHPPSLCILWICLISDSHIGNCLGGLVDQVGSKQC